VATGAKIVEIDYKNEGTIKKAAEELRDTKLDVLINCAGKYFVPKASCKKPVSSHQTLHFHAFQRRLREVGQHIVGQR
jgi:short-subunit dehydrogenase